MDYGALDEVRWRGGVYDESRLGKQVIRYLPGENQGFCS